TGSPCTYEIVTNHTGRISFRCNDQAIAYGRIGKRHVIEIHPSDPLIGPWRDRRTVIAIQYVSVEEVGATNVLNAKTSIFRQRIIRGTSGEYTTDDTRIDGPGIGREVSDAHERTAGSGLSFRTHMIIQVAVAVLLKCDARVLYIDVFKSYVVSIVPGT